MAQAGLFLLPSRLPLSRCGLTAARICGRPLLSNRYSTIPTSRSSQPEEPPEEEKQKLYPLSRPIGLPYAPQPGQHTGKDNRSFAQRRADFASKEKNLEERRELLDEWKRGYYNDWRDMKYHKGKTFLAPPRLFRKDKALYFPNLFGRALDRPGKPRDISPTLKGKVSIVSVYSSVWAQEQADSFTSQKSNPDFHEILKESQGKAQHVVINFSHSRLKALLVRFFMWSIRRSLPKEQHWRYFLVTKGFKRYIGQAIGMSNMSVGHTYLLDRDCKIRWAANAYAQPDEVESLNKGVRRLIAEKDITPSIPGKRKRS